MNKQNCLTWK